MYAGCILQVKKRLQVGKEKIQKKKKCVSLKIKHFLSRMKSDK